MSAALLTGLHGAVIAAGLYFAWDLLRAFVLARSGRKAPDLDWHAMLALAGFVGLLVFAAALGQA